MYVNFCSRETTNLDFRPSPQPVKVTLNLDADFHRVAQVPSRSLVSVLEVVLVAEVLRPLHLILLNLFAEVSKCPFLPKAPVSSEAAASTRRIWPRRSSVCLRHPWQPQLPPVVAAFKREQLLCQQRQRWVESVHFWTCPCFEVLQLRPWMLPIV